MENALGLQCPLIGFQPMPLTYCSHFFSTDFDTKSCTVSRDLVIAVGRRFCRAVSILFSSLFSRFFRHAHDKKLPGFQIYVWIAFLTLLFYILCKPRKCQVG